jgi:signal-transduction protein with cAMP-binding, CBS, and nucleotidyltransferase domain
LNWFPFNNITVDRANKFFIEGKPFTDLTDNQQQTLTEIIKLRNYIAHKSVESKLKVENSCGFKIF